MNTHDLEKPAPPKPDTTQPDDPARGDSPATELINPNVGQVSQTLFRSRIVTVFGEVTDKLAREAVSQLLALASLSTDPIRLFINSPGGHVESGDSIHDMLRFVPAPVQIIG